MMNRRTFTAALAASPLLALKPRPKLLVWVIAEQFRAGGLRRLTEQGTYFPDCRMSASTFTASSLATLVTGAWPSAHGIVADAWYDPKTKQRVAASSDLLRCGTLTDELLAETGSRVFVVGSRLLAGGSRAEFREWQPVSTATSWMALGAKAGTPPLRKLSGEFDPGYHSSPMALGDQCAFCRELIEREKLGAGTGFDALLVSLPAPALLGHEVGGGSPLMQQMLLHVERQMEQLIETLNHMPGAGNYTLAFCGAHGAPEARPNMAVDGEPIAQAMNAARYLYPFVYLAKPDMRRAAAKAAMQLPEVAGYYTADGECSHSGEWRRRFENSFHPPRSGDLMLSYAPNRVELFGEGRGVSYGSLYNYDTRVPLLLYGPQFRARVDERPVEAVDIAPTLARACGIAPPNCAVGRVLHEAFL